MQSAHNPKQGKQLGGSFKPSAEAKKVVSDFVGSWSVLPGSQKGWAKRTVLEALGIKWDPGETKKGSKQGPKVGQKLVNAIVALSKARKGVDSAQAEVDKAAKAGLDTAPLKVKRAEAVDAQKAFKAKAVKLVTDKGLPADVLVGSPGCTLTPEEALAELESA